MKKIYTDYPITELGDIAGEKIPTIREITEILHYDGRLYVLVNVEGVIIEIKRGYLSYELGRVGEVPSLTRIQLNRILVAKYLKNILNDFKDKVINIIRLNRK